MSNSSTATRLHSGINILSYAALANVTKYILRQVQRQEEPRSTQNANNIANCIISNVTTQRQHSVSAQYKDRKTKGVFIV